MAGDASCRLAHLAIIMDGNGRWATQRGLPRLAGHEAGAKAVRAVVRGAAEHRISYLTLYAFSHENWHRPQVEVRGLMRLLRRTLAREGSSLIEEGVRVRVLGERERLPQNLQDEIQALEQNSAKNERLNLSIALSYSGRREILRAVQRLALRVEEGALAAESIDEGMLGQELFTRDLPDPDLIVRTGGEYRLSNFLLWQAAYSEILVLDCLWPDVDAQVLEQMVNEFGHRQRRFGRTPDQAMGVGP